MLYNKGQSGNPNGRPKGISDKRTELRELLKSHAKSLVETAIQRALEGDTAVLKLWLERLMAPLCSRDSAVSRIASTVI